MKILVVDDHPMTAEGYINSIEKGFNPGQISFTTANDCKDAYNIATDKQATPFDIAIIDHRLPPYTEMNIFSGCDLALTIKKTMPGCRIIIITAHTEVLIIYDIYKKANPHGLIIKTDVTPANLPNIIKEVIAGGQYLSTTAKNCIREIWKKDLMIEDYNRQILFYLSKGYKVKELGDVIHLSHSTIQKRVINMKRAFDVSDDNGLIRQAIKQGFI
jgi:DNA-binding NarL/FixJ family response regulator